MSCHRRIALVSSPMRDYEGGAWHNVTSSRSATQICGTVSTLSPFGVAEPPNSAPSLTATASTDVVVRDTTAPSISISTPGSGATYTLNAVVASTYVCDDSASGVATCNGPVASGAALDTTTVGVSAFTVSASDAAGNAATLTASYRVPYAICPLYDTTKVHKSGSTVPIKLRVCDATERNYSPPGVNLNIRGVQLLGTADIGPAEDAGNANPDQAFRYDAALAGYIFNLKTTGLPAGVYGLSFTAGDDPTLHVVQFRVR